MMDGMSAPASVLAVETPDRICFLGPTLARSRVSRGRERIAIIPCRVPVDHPSTSYPSFSCACFHRPCIRTLLVPLSTPYRIRYRSVLPPLNS